MTLVKEVNPTERRTGLLRMVNAPVRGRLGAEKEVSRAQPNTRTLTPTEVSPGKLSDRIASRLFTMRRSVTVLSVATAGLIWVIRRVFSITSSFTAVLFSSTIRS